MTDLICSPSIRKDEKVDGLPLHRPRVGDDPLVPVLLRLAENVGVQAVRRAGCGQRMAPVPLASPLAADRRREESIVPLPVVVVDVLVARGDRHDPPGDQGSHLALAAGRTSAG